MLFRLSHFKGYAVSSIGTISRVNSPSLLCGSSYTIVAFFRLPGTPLLSGLKCRCSHFPLLVFFCFPGEEYLPVTQHWVMRLAWIDLSFGILFLAFFILYYNVADFSRRGICLRTSGQDVRDAIGTWLMICMVLCEEHFLFLAVSRESSWTEPLLTEPVSFAAKEGVFSLIIGQNTIFSNAHDGGCWNNVFPCRFVFSFSSYAVALQSALCWALKRCQTFSASTPFLKHCFLAWFFWKFSFVFSFPGMRLLACLLGCTAPTAPSADSLNSPDSTLLETTWRVWVAVQSDKPPASWIFCSMVFTVLELTS